MRALLALLLVAAPAAAAPLVGVGPFYHGAAAQGSDDDARDWPLAEGRVCAFVVTRFVVTLEVLAGSADDVLALDVPHGGTARATLFEPATVEAVQGDTCPEFTVRGERVAGSAAYRVLAVG